MYIKSLTESGLNFDEAHLYDLILTKPGMTITEMGRRSQMSRAKVAKILADLQNRQIVETVVVGRRSLYKATHPQSLIIHEKEQLDRLTNLLPRLVKTYETATGRPHVNLYEGVAGIAQVIKTAVEEAEYLKSFSSPSTFFGVLTEADAETLMSTIMKRGIYSQSLASDTPENRALLPKLNRSNKEFRIIPGGIVHPVEIMAYNDTTILTSWQRKFAVVVESAEIKNFIEAIFDDLWKKAETV